MSLSDRLRKLEEAAREKLGPDAPPIVLVVPDGTEHPLLAEEHIMTESEADAYRKELVRQGKPAPAFVRLDAQDLGL